MQKQRIVQISFVSLLSLTFVIGLFIMLLPHMKGPRGYYVSEDDPTVFIEFFEKPKAISNILSDFGTAEYTFTAFDYEINLIGPKSAPIDKRRYYEISGEGSRIRVQDLRAEPVGERRVFPSTYFIRQEEPTTE